MWIWIDYLYLCQQVGEHELKAIKNFLSQCQPLYILSPFEVACYIGEMIMKLSLWGSTNNGRYRKASSIIIFSFPMKLRLHIDFGSTQSTSMTQKTSLTTSRFMYRLGICQNCMVDTFVLRDIQSTFNITTQIGRHFWKPWESS